MFQTNAMKPLENYILGKWIKGDDDGQILYHAVTGEPIALASTKGIDFSSVLHYGRQKGNPALRKMSFQERGLMLRALALHLKEQLPKFYPISFQTGATKSDSWIDLEGGIGNLFAYASLRKKFSNQPYCLDGEYHALAKSNNFIGQHLLIPKEGVAIHINAYNFPVWGMLEKIAVNLLAGMPAIIKPATVTSYLTEAVFREIIRSQILPEGALQLICGNASGILDHATLQDVITFTGSASTGQKLKSHPKVLSENIPFTMEADSLNAIVLGEDINPDMPEWDLFIKEVKKEMISKCGQKCTAIRRIFVPENKIEDIQIAISKSLKDTIIGNPLNETVRMGSLAGLTQRKEVKDQLQKLLASSQIIYGSLESVSVVDADAQKGAFISPILLFNQQPMSSTAVHEIEAFGPVATLMPYSSLQEAIALVKLGKGSLVSSIVTNNTDIATEYSIGAGTYHGRILILNRTCSKENTGHGSPLPLLVHGGPGRAGGGEEMGGVRGVKHYMQRVAIQGSPDMITAITKVYQPGATGNIDGIHPFKKYFEELEIGDQIITEKRKVTKADIESFADLSGDHFYAHQSDTDFQGTMFDAQVAHGYLILSMAAGLFVDGKEKNPVLLNYGIDELRFTKPVYINTTIHVRFTCKDKMQHAKKDPTDLNKGIVKWFVEIIDDENEIVGIATILTMVAKMNQE